MFLNLANRQIDTRRVFIGIQRTRLPSREQIDRSLLSGEALALPVRFDGQWEILVGVVRHFTIFPEGMLIRINPGYKGSVLENWPSAMIWIPSSQQEMAGVLNYTGN